MQIRIAGLVPESYVDGDGIRFAIFMQGCQRNCAGCHNPETHSLDGGRLIDTGEIISEVKKNPLLDGITLTGGEPLLQIDAAKELARAAKSLGLSVWLYTGYIFEELPPALSKVSATLTYNFAARAISVSLTLKKLMLKIKSCFGLKSEVE